MTARTKTQASANMEIQRLLNIANCAEKYADAVNETKLAQQALTDAYYLWREDTGVADFIERGSPEWEAMMTATAQEHRELLAAKARERRAKIKLLAAVEGTK